MLPAGWVCLVCCNGSTNQALSRNSRGPKAFRKMRSPRLQRLNPDSAGVDPGCSNSCKTKRIIIVPSHRGSERRSERRKSRTHMCIVYLSGSQPKCWPTTICICAHFAVCLLSGSASLECTNIPQGQKLSRESKIGPTQPEASRGHLKHYRREVCS